MKKKILDSSHYNIVLPHRAGPRYMTITATTTGPNKTVTLDKLTPIGNSMTVNWGDGTANTTIAAGKTTATTHVYSSAGAYTITVSDVRYLRDVNFWDTQLSDFNTEQLRGIPIRIMQASSLPNCVIDSYDMRNWNLVHFGIDTMFGNIDSSHFSHMSGLSSWYLFGMEAGGNYRINSADFVNIPLTNFELDDMPPDGSYRVHSTDTYNWDHPFFYLGYLSTGSYYIDTAHFSTWNPQSITVADLPADGTYIINFSDLAAWNPLGCHFNDLTGATITISAANFSAWKAVYSINFSNLNLSQAQVDAVLEGLWLAFPARTVNPSIYNYTKILINGNNATPSGTYQADTTPDSGKEYAYELKNDTGNVNPTRKWKTITYTE